jgi:DNA-binding FadR family transcriptional regulator
MGHALEEMARYGLSDELGRAADQRFHALILEATGNELLISLSASISAAVRWTTFFKYRGTRKPHDPMPQHQALFEAIANSDALAAREATAVLVRQARIDTEVAIEEETRRAAATAKGNAARG